MTPPAPPRLARRVLARALPIDVRESVLDDLDELFRRDAAMAGAARARIRYWRRALSFASRFVAERLRDRRRSAVRLRMGLSWMDVKLGARMLIKYPGLTLVSVLGMAVAIAIAATSFSFFYSYLFPTLPLDDGHRIVGIENWDTERNNQEHRSLHDFVTWREELTSFEDLGAFRTVRRNLIVPGVPTEQVAVAEMTASGFSIARVPVHMGRSLVRADEQKGAPEIVVIGHDVWQTRFGGDPAIVGRHIRLGALEHQVVGVMPERFAFPLNHGFWVPLRAAPADYERRRGPEMFMFGRLAAGVTREQAQAELTAIGLRAAQAFPDANTRLQPRIVRYTSFWADDVTWEEVSATQLVISLLLVVVGVNVAILIYARTATRHAEIVVRTALGASRRRIVTQLFVESLVLSTIAAASGLLLTSRALAVIDDFLAGMSSSSEFGGVPFWAGRGLAFGTVVYVCGLAVLGALIAGVVPALKATGAPLQVSLRAPGGTATVRLGRTWTGMIVAQVALAVAILPAGFLFVSISAGHRAWGPGFAADRFLTTRLLMDGDLASTGGDAAPANEFDARYADRLTELARRTAGEADVAGVTIASAKPGTEYTVNIELDEPAMGARTAASWHTRSLYVDASFFTTFEVPLLSGRAFLSNDFDESPPAARRDADGDGVPDGLPALPAAIIVNRTFVRQVLGDTNAIGRRLRYADGTGAPTRWHEIVGVVADLPANPILPDETEARVYHPLAPGRTYPMTLHVRLRTGDPAAFGKRLREIATALDPRLRLDQIRPLAEVYRREQLGVHMGALALALVGISVVLLSAAGIYALMSFTVTERRREIGIRAALGAHPRQLLASIFTRALRQLAAGVAVGIAAGVLVDRLGEGELMGGRGAVLLPVVAAVMIAVGLGATIGPARRGLRIQPTDALREE